MNLELGGKVVLLAGGAGTLGQAAAAAFHAEGAAVVIADRDDATCGGVVPLDVTDPDSVAAAIGAVRDKHGPIDVLVVLAGVFQAQSATDISADDWDRLLDANLNGTFLVCREVLLEMRRRDFGRIICLASLAGQVGGVVAGAHYAASKAGVLSLVKSLARQCRDPARPGQDLTINAVSPGPVESAMTAGWSEDERRRMRAQIPVARFARPAEIADVIVFLASPRAGYIHGARIDVNGGAFMG